MTETAEIRLQLGRDVFDYQQLIACLSHLSKPRDRIHKLLARGDIVRIRKGLYAFGRAYRREPHSREVLANLIHGPSYISLEYALSYRGLIPERFETESRYLLQPIPFGLRVYRLPDLFAGKLHAVLCRKWQSRIKGRDWYDLVWYAARHPHVNLGHLETRMRQSGDYGDEEPLTRARLLELLRQRVRQVDAGELRQEVAPFVRERQSLEIWSQDFFLHLFDRIETGH